MDRIGLQEGELNLEAAPCDHEKKELEGRRVVDESDKTNSKKERELF